MTLQNITRKPPSHTRFLMCEPCSNAFILFCLSSLLVYREAHSSLDHVGQISVIHSVCRNILGWNDVHVLDSTTLKTEGSGILEDKPAACELPSQLLQQCPSDDL